MAKLSNIMPALLRHEGVWEGEYIYVDPEGSVIDRHHTRVTCEFPETGEYAYIQHNMFTWPDGRTFTAELPGKLEGDRIWWDTERFHGYAWQTADDIILLNLTRKDEPGAHFFEMITLGEGGRHRARTWQWFKDGQLYKRTLCNETKVSG